MGLDYPAGAGDRRAGCRQSLGGALAGKLSAPGPAIRADGWETLRLSENEKAQRLPGLSYACGLVRTCYFAGQSSLGGTLSASASFEIVRRCGRLLRANIMLIAGWPTPARAARASWVIPFFSMSDCKR